MLIFIKIKAPVGSLKLNKDYISNVLHNKQNLHGDRNCDLIGQHYSQKHEPPACEL